MHFEELPMLHAIYVKISGRLTAFDIVNAFDTMLEQPIFITGMNSLWDLNDATHPDLTAEDLKVIGAHVKRYEEQRGNGRVAWVVATDVDFGIARMFEMTTDNEVPFEFRVFRDIVEAKLWLGEPVKKENADPVRNSIYRK